MPWSMVVNYVGLISDSNDGPTNLVTKGSDEDDDTDEEQDGTMDGDGASSLGEGGERGNSTEEWENASE